MMRHAWQACWVSKWKEFIINFVCFIYWIFVDWEWLNTWVILCRPWTVKTLFRDTVIQSVGNPALTESYQSCRWGSSGWVRSWGWHSEGRGSPKCCSTPLCWPHSDIAHTSTAGTHSLNVIDFELLTISQSTVNKWDHGRDAGWA